MSFINDIKLSFGLGLFFRLGLFKKYLGIESNEFFRSQSPNLIQFILCFSSGVKLSAKSCSRQNKNDQLGHKRRVVYLDLSNY